MVNTPEAEKTEETTETQVEKTPKKLAKPKKIKKAAGKTAKAKPKAVPKKKVSAKKKEKEERPLEEGEDEDEEEDVEIVEDEEDEEDGDEEVYHVKQKPKLTKSQSTMLQYRSSRKAKEPEFHRQEWFRYKKLGDSWRKPRGLHSKMRKNVKYRPKMARIGFGSPKSVKGRHPSGFEEILVHRPDDLEGIDPKTQAVRIGHQVGTRKRIAIEDKADELGIRILNRGSV